MQNKFYYLLFLASLALAACGTTNSKTGNTAVESSSTAAANVNSSVGEWESLFNGEDLSGWHKYGAEGTVGSAWKVDDGAIHFSPSDERGSGGDLITDEVYANYELELEWKIGDCGNSGIIYNVQEEEQYSRTWLTGPEMQVIDNSCHPDAKNAKHRAGDLYDMVAMETENTRPAGEWNKVNLIVTDGKVEHWVNGEKQVEYANKGEEWKQMIAGSKFRDMPNWGMFTSGKIALQDHGDPVWYRNIRIRQLSK